MKTTNEEPPPRWVVKGLGLLLMPFLGVALIVIIAGVVCVFPFAFVYVLISESIKGRRDRARRSRALKTTLILPNE